MGTPHKPSAALFRAPLNTHTSLRAAIFRAPAQTRRPITGQFILTNHRSVYSDQWQDRLTNRSLHKKRPLSSSSVFSPVLSNLYVKDVPSPSHHIELALYANDTAIIATSHKPTLLVSYLESYLNDLQQWLSEWRIAIYVSKKTAIIFACAGRRFIHPRPVTLFGEPIQWVKTSRYLGVTLDKRPSHLTSNRLERKLLKGWASWVPF